MPLYGHELGVDTLPAQAGLGRVVNLAKDTDFVGRAASEEGPDAEAPVLVGLIGEGKRAARAGYPVFADSDVADGEDAEVGVVTSGALSPTLGVPIAMAYVAPQLARDPAPSSTSTCAAPASRFTVTALPFYSRKKHYHGRRTRPEVHRRARVAPRSRATSRPSASPPTPPRSSATSSSSSCPRRAATSTSGRVVGEIESTKSVGELFAPVDGTVAEANSGRGRRARAGQLRPVRRGLAGQGRASPSCPTTSSATTSTPPSPASKVDPLHDRLLPDASHRHRRRRAAHHAVRARATTSRRCACVDAPARPRLDPRRRRRTSGAARAARPSVRRCASCVRSPRATP